MIRITIYLVYFLPAFNNHVVTRACLERDTDVCEVGPFFDLRDA
jgi:hypothetical protein